MNCNLIHNLFELPYDIISMIYLYLDIEHIEILYSMYNHNFLSELKFWTDYFKLHSLKMMKYQQNCNQWIIEFKVCSILDKFNLKNYRCEHHYIYKNMLLSCNNTPLNKHLYCQDHTVKYDCLSLDTSKRETKIKCNPFDVNYVKRFNYNFKSISHYYTFTFPEIIITVKHITLYVEAVKFTINYYDDNIIHDFLFQLFCDGKIKNIK